MEEVKKGFDHSGNKRSGGRSCRCDPRGRYITAQSSFFLGLILGLVSYYAILLLKEHWKIDMTGCEFGSWNYRDSWLTSNWSCSYYISESPWTNWSSLWKSYATCNSGARNSRAAIMGFVGTIVIMKIINRTIGLRVEEHEEDIGLDIAQHAERNVE